MSWQDVFPLQEREIYEKAGFCSNLQSGKRPCLLIVDVVESFLSPAEDIFEAISEYSTSCGKAGWDALARIKQVLEAARSAGILVVYVKGDPVYKTFCGDSVKGAKNTAKIHSTNIPAVIAPNENEFLIKKTKASAFFQTPLTIYLTQHGIDSLFVVGTSTSGCIRASVVDGFSHGYPIFVIDECCFDRSRLSHEVSLYEMNAKYADVITVEEALRKIMAVKTA